MATIHCRSLRPVRHSTHRLLQDGDHRLPLRGVLQSNVLHSRLEGGEMGDASTRQQWQVGNWDEAHSCVRVCACVCGLTCKGSVYAQSICLSRL